MYEMKLWFRDNTQYCNTSLTVDEEKCNECKLAFINRSVVAFPCGGVDFGVVAFYTCRPIVEEIKPDKPEYTPEATQSGKWWRFLRSTRS